MINDVRIIRNVNVNGDVAKGVSPASPHEYGAPQVTRSNLPMSLAASLALMSAVPGYSLLRGYKVVLRYV
jgi:hypothetical protein